VLPSYGGTRASYLEFAVVGIAVSNFMQLALTKVAVGIRGEQMVGTLESLLMTPTSPVTIQIGTVFYDLLYVPIRTTVFLVLTSVAFGLDYDPSGLLPAVAVLLVFIPFVWGLGVANAGLILTFRRGGGIAGFGATILTVLSGAFFPLALLPVWLRGVASANPVTVAVDAMRNALIGGTGWEDAGPAALQLLPYAAVSLVVGFVVFHLALGRERRRGSLGLY
jgi:ABC-2 type transport system permease protein